MDQLMLAWEGCQSCSWSAEQEKIKFPCSSPGIWSGETGSAEPSRVSLLVLHIQTGSGAYSEDSSRFPRWRPFIYTAKRCQVCPANRVTPLRTDGVHCREAAGAGLVILKVVPVTGAAFSSITMDQSMCASLSPRPLHFYWYEVVIACVIQKASDAFSGHVQYRKYSI